MTLYDYFICYVGGAYRANVCINSGSGLVTWKDEVDATNTDSGRMHQVRIATMMITQYYLYLTGNGANRTYAAYGELENT